MHFCLNIINDAFYVNNNINFGSAEIDSEGCVLSVYCSILDLYNICLMWLFCYWIDIIIAEGVCYAKKDFNLAKHPDIDVPNLQVIKLMQSFKSKEYVRETFAWMHYYWYLTNDGIEFLRTYLNLPSEIVPATLKKQMKPAGRPGPGGDRPRYVAATLVKVFAGIYVLR